MKKLYHKNEAFTFLDLIIDKSLLNYNLINLTTYSKEL
jgi:hypothetical protein